MSIRTASLALAASAMLLGAPAVAFAQGTGADATEGAASKSNMGANTSGAGMTTQQAAPAQATQGNNNAGASATSSATPQSAGETTNNSAGPVTNQNENQAKDACNSGTACGE